MNIVSIVMPAYNSEEFIGQAIDSVLNQSYEKWELIIINDCSSDNTAEIIRKYIKTDKRIKVITHIENKGVAESRNDGIRAAKGTKIAFLDSDDVWMKEKLKYQVETVKKNECDCVFTGYRFIDVNGKEVNKCVKVKSCKVMYNELLKENIIGCSTLLAKKECFNELLFEKTRHEDYVLWLKLLKNNFGILGMDKELVFYRSGNENSISGNKIRSAMWTWKIYREKEKLSIVKAIYFAMNYGVRLIKRGTIGGKNEN